MTQQQTMDYQKATDVLQLEEPFSDDDVNRAADAYEVAHGIPLVRPGEWDYDEGRPNKKFTARIKSFESKNEPTLSGDPAIHRRELRKLLEVAKKKGIANLSDREKAGIHELQKALGLPQMDFAKKQRPAKQIVKEAQETFAEIQKAAATYHERIAAISTMTDITTLQLFAEHDKSEEVREAAFERIQVIEVDAIPGV